MNMVTNKKYYLLATSVLYGSCESLSACCGFGSNKHIVECFIQRIKEYPKQKDQFNFLKKTPEAQKKAIDDVVKTTGNDGRILRPVVLEQHEAGVGVDLKINPVEVYNPYTTLSSLWSQIKKTHGLKTLVFFIDGDPSRRFDGDDEKHLSLGNKLLSCLPANGNVYQYPEYNKYSVIYISYLAVKNNTNTNNNKISKKSRQLGY